MNTLTPPHNPTDLSNNHPVALDRQTGRLRRAVWIAFGGLILISLTFAGYYYWDRYAHPGDRTPMEISITLLEEQVRTNPSAIEPRLALAEVYISSQSYQKAIEQAQQVLHAYPDNQQAVLLLGIAFVLDNELAPGIAALEQFTTTGRKSPTAGTDSTLQTGLYYLGTAYLQNGQAAAAVPVLEEALAISSIDADTLFQLGLAYSQLGQHHQAISNYHQATSFVPDFYDAYQEMERSYLATGEADLALYSRGMQKFALEDYSQALSDLQTVVQKQPDFAPAWLGLGLVQERLGDLQAAQQSLQQAQVLDPDNFVISSSLARLEGSLIR